ncbi:MULTISPECIES: hypothetical protein [unclassified Streptomyces]|uniref:hypothetical protein n=1 Tax=unclassified Streptomyces TaxID=2593676 RepID=UPI0035D5F793
MARWFCGTDPHDQGGDAYVSAGTYFMHCVVTEDHFHTTPVIGTRIFILPGDALRPLVAGTAHRSGHLARGADPHGTPAWCSGP